MENCKLPRDLLIDILARLSVKSLIRFKSVCKFFYDLIKNDHQFMRKHYEFGQAKNHCVILEFQSPNYSINTLQFYLLYKESEFSESRCIYLDMPNSKIRFVKCCNGMLCLIVGKGYPSVDDINEITSPDMIFDVFTLNPFTREIKVLPSIKMPNKPPNKPPVEYLLRIGFGFGLSNNLVWKIIMLVRFEDARRHGEDIHEIVMVCNQVGDSWDWRQINAVSHGCRRFPYFNNTQDFYLKGKYYWHCCDCLIWFDMDDEVFGVIKIPSTITDNVVTVMNETIAVIGGPYEFVGDEGYIKLWLMDENNNIINWKKQASIHFGYNIKEYWAPAGIWNFGAQLLVFSGHFEFRYNEVTNCWVRFFKDDNGPNLISIDLVSQEKKNICINQEKKRALNIGLNSTGHAQVCTERNITKAQDWNESNIDWFDFVKPYARIFNESLKLL